MLGGAALVVADSLAQCTAFGETSYALKSGLIAGADDGAGRLMELGTYLHEVEEALRGTSYLKELYDLQFFGYADR